MSNELLTDDASGLSWFKSSYSSSEGGACVEVAAAHAHARAVHVRDSKDVRGGSLCFREAQWAAFVASVRD